MAIATLAVLTKPSPRYTAAASSTRVPPRVYSPFPSRRLARPMAVRAGVDAGSAGPSRTRWSLFRGGRRDTTLRDRSA
jgi:hypothetical protein